MQGEIQKPEVFSRKRTLRNFAKFTVKQISFLNEVADWRLIKKETLAQVLSGEFTEISENTIFPEHLLATDCFWIFSQVLLLFLFF